jgi:hypothetical protein
MMRSRRLFLLLTAAAAIAVFPVASAMAARAPTNRERTALIKAFDSRIHLPVPAVCFHYKVSTVNQSWALMTSVNTLKNGPPLSRLPSPFCAKFIGRYLLHRSHHHWRVLVGSVGKGVCTPVKNGAPPPKPGSNSALIPAPVARDLKLC